LGLERRPVLRPHRRRRQHSLANAAHLPGGHTSGSALQRPGDGLVEARDRKEEYGVKRLRQKIAELGARPAAEIILGIMDTVMSFTSGGEQKDDVTLAVVKKRA